MVSRGGLEPPRPLRALAPQASASAIPPPGRGDARARGIPAARETLARCARPKRPAAAGAGAGRPRHTVSGMTAGTTPSPPRRPTPTAERRGRATSARDLIRIDTSNYGDGRARASARPPSTSWPSSPRSASTPELLEREPGRTSVVARVEGEDSVAARPSCCTATSTSCRPTPPTGGRPLRRRGARRLLWGRGAVDMKDMDAMILAAIRRLRPHRDERPPRDTIVRLLRRRGGRRHARQPLARRPPPAAVRRRDRGDQRGRRLLRHRPTPRASSAPTCCRRPRRASPGCGCARTAAPATARVPNDDNAIVRLAEADRPDRRARVAARVHRLGPRAARHARHLTGLSARPTDDLEPLLATLGGAQGFVARHAARHGQPDVLDAGLQAQRHPADGDGADRLPLPARPRGRLLGHDPRARRRARRGRDRAPRHRPRGAFSGDLVDAMMQALLARGPRGGRAALLPLRRHRQQGAAAGSASRGYGFAPLRLPADLDFAPMFHGVDERVPLDSLRSGRACSATSCAPAEVGRQRQAVRCDAHDLAPQPHPPHAALVDHRARELPTAVLRMLTDRLPRLGLRRVAVEREDPVLVIRHRHPF